MDDIVTRKLKLIVILFCLLIIVRLRRRRRIPRCTSILTGAIHCQELLNHPNPETFRQTNRMTKAVFHRLHNKLVNDGELVGGRKVSTQEKLMIFIHILKGHSIRDTANCWQHSTQCISDTVHEVIAAFNNIKDELFYPPKPATVPTTILNNNDFYPYFRDCIGALDGTHIPAVVGSDETVTERALLVKTS